MPRKLLTQAQRYAGGVRAVEPARTLWLREGDAALQMPDGSVVIDTPAGAFLPEEYSDFSSVWDDSAPENCLSNNRYEIAAALGKISPID